MKKKSFNAILTLMRVFLLLIAIGLSSVYANPVLGQVKVDIDVKSVSIEEVFKEIQKKSDYVFFYKDNVLKNNKKISLKLNNVKVSKILDQVFLNTDLNYIIVEKQIVVKKIENKNSKSSKQENSQVQEKTVSGIVSDNNGQPLPGANILIKGTTKGVQTDFDGNYEINLPDGEQTLVFSYLGFKTQEVEINGRSNINVVLEIDLEGLDEVVITGYGEVRRKDLTGSVAKVNGDDPVQLPKLTEMN